MADPWSEAEVEAAIAAVDGETCEYAGHDWQPAGGGLLICTECLAEKWDPADDPQGGEQGP